MVSEDNSRSEKTIKGLSFRDIQVEQSEGEEGDSIFSQRRSSLRGFAGVLNGIAVYACKRSLLARFFAEFFSYFFIRSRIIITVLGVLGEISSGSFHNLKKGVVNKLFWGRGKLSKITAQFLGILLIFLVLTSYTYQSAILEHEEISFTQVQAARSDLLIQGASTNTPIPEDRSRMDSEEYIVRTGDTISSIAEYYGLDEDTILWANDLDEGADIESGDTLEIPPGDGLNVEVEKGDTLDDLAEKYATSPQMIIDINWLDYPFELTEGETLFIPDAEKPEPEPEPHAPTYTGIVTEPHTPDPSRPAEGRAERFLNNPVAGGAGNVLQCFSGWHNGIDFSASEGTNIVAAASGEVTFSGCQSGGCPPLGSLHGGHGLAWTVIIDHGNGYSTIYGHLSDLHVDSGETVSAGDPIGTVGATGTAYGLHVHFMLIEGGGWNWINPAPYMNESMCGY